MKKTWKRYRLISMIMILALILGCAIGSAIAKYVYSTQVQATVVFTAELAEKLELLESTAKRNAGTGEYTLDKPETETNTYVLMPGVDIPKDPFVRITKKSPVPSYLYIEVVATHNSAIGYTIDSNSWVLLESVPGKQGGKVYLYKTSDSEPLTNDNCPTEVIYILKDNKITVSQTLLTADAETTATDPVSSNDSLTFYAYLFETYEISPGNYATSGDVFNGITP